jgi:hypothetical protein
MQSTVIDVPGHGRFWLGISRDLSNLSKSSVSDLAILFKGTQAWDNFEFFLT